MREWMLLFFSFFTIIACQQNDKGNANINRLESSDTNKVIVDSAKTPGSTDIALLQKNFTSLPDSAFVELALYDENFKFDIKYATTDNFTKKRLYDCANCLLRKQVADTLFAAQQYLQKLGYGLLLFDCYRPLTVQQKMWEMVSNPIYVADPAKGSMHNRGNAVDLTLYDLASGKPLDMGTEFDFFGKEAHHAYQQLPKEVLKNRLLLKEILEKFGFKSITSEWWHYSYNASVFPLSSTAVPCH
ncbi:MAG: D-alanyl-D-alanine dipeptidase [Bacteroidota bacterium]